MNILERASILRVMEFYAISELSIVAIPTTNYFHISCSNTLEIRNG